MPVISGYWQINQRRVRAVRKDENNPGFLVVISALREWMAELGKRTSVAVSYVGKLKTTLQMVAIIILLFGVPGTATAKLGLFCMLIAAVLTLWSMLIYLKAAWFDLTSEM